MSSSHQVPSTTNVLSHSQRVRIMRSTRKLGEMLGTTPFINGSERPVAIPVRSSSLQRSSSLRLSQKKGKKPLPRPLVLSLHALPASPKAPAGPTTPLSPTTNMPSFSAYHDDREGNDLQIRRKRIAKLKRTLGNDVPVARILEQQNISPELVFESRSRPSRPRSCSVDAGALAATFQVNVISPTEPTFQHPQSPIRSSTLQVPPKPRTLASRLRQRHVHTSSLGLEGLHLQQVTVEEPVRKSTDSAWSMSSTTSSKSNKETYRKQAGWSGEWNREDLQDVMNRLRGLKAA